MTRQTCKGCEKEQSTSNFPIRGRHRRKYLKRSPYCNACTQRFERNLYNGMVSQNA